MIRLVYISQAVVGITEEQVQNILKTSQKNNSANGITGVLSFGGGLFMQILEGSEQAVLRLYVKILDDPRHTDCRLIHISPADEQVFQKWSMAILGTDPLDYQRIGELRARRLETVQSQTFTHLMREFVRKLGDARGSAA
jgi:Sensors of blue-light using FAD